MLFAPAAADEAEIFARLSGPKPLVVENILSGPGIARLHRALSGQALTSDQVITNAKAGVTGDFDQADDGRPSLKKRQPDAADSSNSDSSNSSSSSDGPPKLKKRDDPGPKPTPTPSPEL